MLLIPRQAMVAPSAGEFFCGFTVAHLVGTLTREAEISSPKNVSACPVLVPIRLHVHACVGFIVSTSTYKIAISDAILLKSGKLTDEEFTIMKGHVPHGADIAGKYRWLKDALEIIRFHHEKFDGSGYPYRLRSNEIPLNARIFSIVDVFDALTSDRPYKEAFPLETAMDELEKGRDTHFDPTLLNAFLRIAGSLHTELYKADEEKLDGILDSVINRYFNETTSIRQNQ